MAKYILYGTCQWKYVFNFKTVNRQFSYQGNSFLVYQLAQLQKNIFMRDINLNTCSILMVLYGLFTVPPVVSILIEIRDRLCYYMQCMQERKE